MPFIIGAALCIVKARISGSAKNLRQRDGTVRRILVFFGGADPSNETAKALHAIQLLNRPDIAVDVVIGSANPHRAEIEVLCAELPNTLFYCQVSNMAELMARADLAIGAGGSTSWERCCLGLPSIIIAVAQNQIQSVKTLSNLKIINYVGEARAINENRLLHVFRHSFIAKWLRKTASCSLNLVDGKGVAWTVQEMI